MMLNIFSIVQQTWVLLIIMQLFSECLLINLVFIITALAYSDAHCSGNTWVSYTCYKPQQWKTTHYRRCGWLLRKRCIKYVSYYYRYIKRTCYRYQKCRIVDNSENGGWSSWGSWTEGKCSASCRRCGASQYPHQRRYRYRSCSNPKPRNGGRNCIGSSYQYTNNNCNTNYCKVNGGWSSWKPFESWGKCSAKCKRCGSSTNPNQTRRRYRVCTNPAPACNGNSCSGSRYITSSKSCNTHYCKVNGGWSSWKTWESWGKCSVRELPNPNQTRRRYRVCNNPIPACNGKSCSGPRYITSSKSCYTPDCSVKELWGKWTKWTKCTPECHKGEAKLIQTRSRKRLCNKPTPPCKVQPCFASDSEKSTKECKNKDIRVNESLGLWGKWTKWTECAHECRKGGVKTQSRSRKRLCNSLPPPCKTKPCSGSDSEISTQVCNKQKFPGSGKCGDEAMHLACSILKNSNITLMKSHSSGKDDRAYPFNNINDTCNGERAERSAYGCTKSNDVPAPGGSVCLNKDLLQYVHDLGRNWKIIVNELAGACHMVCSWHYEGRAADLHLPKGSYRETYFTRACKSYNKGEVHIGLTHHHCEIEF